MATTTMTKKRARNEKRKMKQKRNKTKKPAPKKPAPKKPASKKKEPPLMCCAGDLCQQQGSGGIIIGSNGHPCIACKKRMHGNVCSDGKSDDMIGMTCKKCAASAKTGRKGHQTKVKPKQSQPPPTPLSAAAAATVVIPVAAATQQTGADNNHSQESTSKYSVIRIPFYNPFTHSSIYPSLDFHIALPLLLSITTYIKHATNSMITMIVSGITFRFFSNYIAKRWIIRWSCGRLINTQIYSLCHGLI